jgi:hypothetical protein
MATDVVVGAVAAEPQAQAVEQHQEQRPFWLRHEADPIRIYGLGVELAAGALVLWLDPFTGQNRFHGFLSAADALLQLQRQLGPATPLIVVWDERPFDDDIPFVEEDFIITKAKAPDGIDCGDRRHTRLETGTT